MVLKPRLILGVGGAGGVTGKPAAHYTAVKDTCVTCHLGGAGPDANHTFTPNVATCVQCHADATSLDVNGVQTEIKGKLDEVQKALQRKGLVDKDGVVVVGDYPKQKRPPSGTTSLFWKTRVMVSTTRTMPMLCSMLHWQL